MAQRRLRPLPLVELAGLSTPRLLSYRSKLLALEESAASSDLDANEVSHLPAGFLYFKEDPAWHEQCAALNEVLSDREHIE